MKHRSNTDWNTEGRSDFAFQSVFDLCFICGWICISPGRSFASLGNPWLDMAGMWDANDPLFQEWQQAIAELRSDVGNEDAA